MRGVMQLNRRKANMTTRTPTMPRKAKADYETAKIRKEIMRKARVLSAHHEEDLAKYLSDQLEQIIEREYEKMVKAMTQGPKR